MTFAQRSKVIRQPYFSQNLAKDVAIPIVKRYIFVGFYCSEPSIVPLIFEVKENEN